MTWFLVLWALLVAWLLWCAIRYLKKIEQHIAEIRDEKTKGYWR